MERKIGRFLGQVPDRELFQTLIDIFALIDVKEGTEIEFPANKLHMFFCKAKEKFPEVLDEVYFNSDPAFPYSREVAESFIRLQESEFLTRPNPSLNQYRINIDFRTSGSDENNPPEPVKEIAAMFKNEFKIDYEPAC